MKRILLLVTALTCLLCPALPAQARPDSASAPPASHSALRLTFHDYGLCFGNAARTHGLRFNWRDRGLERVDGLNFTFWQPRDNPDAVINGLAIGLIAPRSARINGVSLGGIAVVGKSSLRGIQAGGIAVVSEGDLGGLNLAGIAVVGEKQVSGFSAAGVAVVSEGHVNGISLSGVATVSEGRMLGIAVGGLAVVSKGPSAGIEAAGLATVAEGTMTGLSLSGLTTVCNGTHTGIAASAGAIISEESVRGLTVGGIALPSRVGEGPKRWSLSGIKAQNLSGLMVHGMNVQADERASGIVLSGIHIGAKEIRGLCAAPWIGAKDIGGVAVGCLNSFSHRQIGISIGLVNLARTLKGIQFGLINYAGNNPAGLKILPIVNAHLK